MRSWIRVSFGLLKFQGLLTILFVYSVGVGATTGSFADEVKKGDVSELKAKPTGKKPEAKPNVRNVVKIPTISKRVKKGPWSKTGAVTLTDLRGIQRQMQAVLPKARKATVSVQIGGGSGSGVIVSKDGYVLTAAHVSRRPGLAATLVFEDGRKARGVTLGLFVGPGGRGGPDAGMIKITQKGDWPYVNMGDSSTLKQGEWCFALGYPAGYDKERGPVMRIGRIIKNQPDTLMTDCTLLGGDSGGPLFDFEGNVIGIHSRIARPTDWNFHAPVDAFRDKWVEMIESERVVYDPDGVASPNTPFLGVQTAETTKGLVVDAVVKGSSAAKAGIKKGDLILMFDKKKPRNPGRLYELVKNKKVGDAVIVTVKRGKVEMSLRIKLGRRGLR